MRDSRVAQKAGITIPTLRKYRRQGLTDRAILAGERPGK